MTPADTTNAYLQSKVFSARPEELRLMLIEGALKFAHQARRGIETGDHELMYEGFTQCRAIVLELMTSIDSDAAGEVGEKVKGVLSFMYTELIQARRDKDLPRLDKVIGLLDYERETWMLAMEHLASLQGHAARPAPTGGEPDRPAGGFSLSA